jgi:acyl-homoserine-lactone acylase
MDMLRNGLIGLVFASGLAALALLFWEPLTAPRHDPPPARRYDATISRDAWGVPLIEGATDADVAHGLAWAHAEDDFGTLQEVLLSTRARSAVALGADGAKVDYVAHLLDVRDTVDRDYARLPADVRALLDAYAAGLNRYAAAHPAEVRAAALFPVNGRDIVAGFVLRSPFFYGLDGVIGPLAEGRLPPRQTPATDERGSNAFAVSARASTDATTRLVVNSHQPWTGPVAWYEVRLRSGEGWEFAGALFPGAPFPLLGHNPELGWANTVNRPDLIDVYRLVLDASGTRYRFDGSWKPLVKRRVWLRVGVGPFVVPVPRTVYRSIHGPVIVNAMGAFAVRYAGIGEVRSVAQYYRLGKARSFDAWRRAMAMQAVAATNFVYADRAGNVALVYNGLFPHRASGFDWGGVLPGDTSKALWRSYVPPAEVPTLVNPRSGFIANANNQPWQASADADNLRRDDWSPLLGVEQRTTNRSLRIFERYRADSDGRLSRDELLGIKFDTGYSRAGWAGAWMAALLAARDPSLAEAQALLRRWDWTLDGSGAADALAVAVLQDGARAAYRGQPLPDAAPTLRRAVARLRRLFGRLDPPLGALLRLRRGGVDIAVSGGPDALRAIYHADADDGRLVGDTGDSFIMLVEWPRRGAARSQTVHQFGARVERPDSRHYNDQAALFARQRFKRAYPFPRAHQRYRVGTTARQ